MSGTEPGAAGPQLNSEGAEMIETTPTVLTLLRLVAARADGRIGGETVDAKIDELTARFAGAGEIVEVVVTD
jgi:hypothetical protein